MLGKFTYFSLGVASISAQFLYDEQNLVNVAGVDQKYTSYYQDETSTYRVPGWMKKAPYSAWLSSNDLGVTHFQNNGIWNTKGAADSLGNGRPIVTDDTPEQNKDKSNVSQKAFIDAVKAFQVGPNGYAKKYENKLKGKTPFSAGHHASTAANDDPWDHIENFWLRDGHLFALILDDRANEMIHGGVSDPTAAPNQRQFKQTDVSISDQQGQRVQRIQPMDHHMEHLREFCNYMGGDLWAPSSQAEYDDLMEREGGVCDKHVEALENGVPVNGVANKVEIYLNIHRDGYLRCPPTATYTKLPYQNADNKVYNERCPSDKTVYGNYGTLDRNMNNNVEQGGSNDWRTFMTTDPWFADDINGDGGMCRGPNDSVNEYAYWDMNSEDADCQGTEQNNLEDKPYIHSKCFNSDTRHRFQKFVELDIAAINNVLDNDFATDQLQKDCVVATCNNDVDSKTGPEDDRRAKSEWNMDNCNLQRHTGICRIRAFGCNAPTYECKAGFNRWCGSHSVYTQSITTWATQPITNFGYTSDITILINQEDNIKDVMFATAAQELDMLLDLADHNSQGYCDADLSLVEVIVDNRPANLETCVCKCTDETCRASNSNFRNTVANFLDEVRGQSFSGDRVCSGTLNGNVANDWCHDIGTSHTWQCTNTKAPTCDCYSGSHNSRCVMKSNGYEAEFQVDAGLNQLSDVCLDNCCPTYENSRWNNAATITKINGVDLVQGGLDLMCMKRGDKYTVSCRNGLHQVGNPLVDTVEYTVNREGECYTPFNCQERECECQEKENGYCYAADGDHTTFGTNKQLVCRCNEGFVNTHRSDSNTHLPYDILTCVNGIFDRSQMGTCVPVRCANPYDLLDTTGAVIGKPVKGETAFKSFIGGRIEYQCREGYQNAQADAPYAVCLDADPNTDAHPSGQFGCYGPIVGTCEPIKGCDIPDAVYANAWKAAVYRPGEIDRQDCHSDAMHYELSDSFRANQPYTNTSVAHNYNHGDMAIYECYDDFIFGLVKKKFLFQASKPFE